MLIKETRNDINVGIANSDNKDIISDYIYLRIESLIHDIKIGVYKDKEKYYENGHNRRFAHQ